MRNHLLLCAFLLICGGLNAQTQLLGSPTTLVKNRGAFMSDSLLYIPKRSKTPADSGAIRYQISDSAIYVWTGSQWIKAGAGGTVTSITAGTGLSGGTITSSGTIAADTTVLSTRLWRQKAVDSLQANINLKVNISDTATMLSPYIRAAGYGLTKSSQSLLVDTAAIATRARVQKGIDSLGAAKQNVLTNPVTGTGTTNYVAKFTGTSAVGNSIAYDNGTDLLINTTSDAGVYPLQVSGNIYNTNDAHFSVTGGGVGIGIGSSPSKLWIYGGSLSTSSTGGSGFASRLTTGRTGTFDADRLTSFHNYFDSESIEIASGSSNTYVSGISVTGRGATNYSGTVRFITSSTERMRITSDGRILAGTTSAFSGGLNEQRIQSYGTDDLAGFSALRVSANTGGSRFVLAKSRGATYTIVNNNDGLGIISFQGADGSTLYRSAEISGQVDGTPSAGSVPGRLVFETNMSERMRIKSDGEVLIATTSDAGDYKLQVGGNIYASGSIVTGSSITPSALYVAGMTTGNGAVYHTGSRLTLANYNTNGTLEFEVNGGTYAMRIDSAGNVGINQTVPTEKLHVGGNIMTAAPSGGTAKPFKIGEAATVSPTSPNRTIRVEIDGTVYYIHAKTTND